jgi:hypothetical protein
MSIYTANSCINEWGNPVDSWAIFKLPQGTSYYYYDNTTFALSSYSLNDTINGALANTMQQLWNAPSNYLFFNDEYIGQDAYNFTVGHSKGVWMWDAAGQGLMIQHSMPKFPVGGPKTQSEYGGLPDNVWEYGQHVYCFTGNIETIAQLYSLVLPQIYESQYTVVVPAVLQLLEGQYNIAPVCKHSGQIFAKTTAWNDDLYAACIAPFYGADCAVESWLHGSDPEGPYCGKQTTVDVQTVQFPGAPSFSTMDGPRKGKSYSMYLA